MEEQGSHGSLNLSIFDFTDTKKVSHMQKSKRMNNSLETLLENKLINFKTAKDINNDFIIMLKSLQELTLETDIGREVKTWFEEILIYELEKLESCKLVL